MTDRIAKIISTMFHPMFVPLYAIILLMNMDYFFFYRPVHKLYIITVVLMFTCLTPGFFTYVMYRLKLIDSIQVEDRKQRYIIYIVSLISFGICMFLLWRIRLDSWVLLLIFCSFLALLAITVINFLWKISIHAAVAGCFTGGVFFTARLLSLNPVLLFVLTLFFSGLVLSARLQLKAHTAAQLTCGYFLGIFFTGILPLFFLVS